MHVEHGDPWRQCSIWSMPIFVASAAPAPAERVRAPEAPKPAFGFGHSSISEKSSPCLDQGTILTHMVPDFARWQIRVGGVMLFGASERPLNHPGDDLVDPIVPIPEDGAH